MKPVYVILLVGAAAIGGGLVVRYRERPVDVARGMTTVPAVVAPPVAPREPIVVEPAPAAVQVEPAEAPSSRPEKTSAFSHTVHVGRNAPVVALKTGSHYIPPDPPAVVAVAQPESLPVGRNGPEKALKTGSRYIPPDPPAVVAVAQPESPASAPFPPASPQPNHVMLPAGTLIAVRINEALSSDRNSQGDVFSGTLEKPVIADGFVIAERGAQVRGEVVDAKRAGRVQGVSELTLRLKELATSDGQNVSIQSQAWRKQGATSTGTDAAKVGAGAVLGAIIGAIAGGGKGAGIGAGVGGAAGAGDVLLTRGGPVNIRPETSITFRLERPVEITERQ